MRVSTLLFALLFCLGLNAQQEAIEPIEWTHIMHENNDGSYNVVFRANIEEDWVLYSQHTNPDGPVPTSFEFDSSECLVLDGKVEESDGAITENSLLFGVDVIKFKEQATFTQKIIPTCDGVLASSITFMTCDGERCLPPKEVKFKIEFD